MSIWCKNAISILDAFYVIFDMIAQYYECRNNWQWSSWKSASWSAGKLSDFCLLCLEIVCSVKLGKTQNTPPHCSPALPPLPPHLLYRWLPPSSLPSIFRHRRVSHHRRAVPAFKPLPPPLLSHRRRHCRRVATKPPPPSSCRRH